MGVFPLRTLPWFGGAPAPLWPIRNSFFRPTIPTIRRARSRRVAVGTYSAHSWRRVSHESKFHRWRAWGSYSRNCQTFTATPAEPGAPWVTIRTGTHPDLRATRMRDILGHGDPEAMAP